MSRHTVPGYQTKTPGMQILGVFVFLSCWLAPAIAQRPAEKIDESVRVAQVVDGDTLRLEDGRRIRVLGINAPELRHDGQPEQPLAEAALEATRAFLKEDAAVHLSFDREHRDRYDRVLAHVYSSKGESLSAYLLHRGLAFHVVVPPNIKFSDCLAAQENRASIQRAGIWREDYWQPRSAANLTVNDAGFMRVSGKVVRVDVKRDIWLELDGAVVIKIPAADRDNFKSQDWQAWISKQLTVRGWVINRANNDQHRKGFKPLLLQLRHPAMLERNGT